ncbi:unnamed protein product [Periconia digitata]|uniref:Uncharacterized protein n=1 Tax=Periconia digitata TaxID=1303443 RepID=A0A9W4XPX6_9PLEO|nr:unnamed protein product [Periconia digitata]
MMGKKDTKNKIRQELIPEGPNPGIWSRNQCSFPPCLLTSDMRQTIHPSGNPPALQACPSSFSPETYM